jgi:hypothetical protein
MLDCCSTLLPHVLHLSAITFTDHSSLFDESSKLLQLTLLFHKTLLFKDSCMLLMRINVLLIVIELINTILQHEVFIVCNILICELFSWDPRIFAKNQIINSYKAEIIL